MSTLTPVVRSEKVGHYSAYRRGGYHAEEWIVVLQCGHAQSVAVNPGKTPNRPRKCSYCSSVARGHAGDFALSNSRRLHEQLARIDAEREEVNREASAMYPCPKCGKPISDHPGMARCA